MFNYDSSSHHHHHHPHHSLVIVYSVNLVYDHYILENQLSLGSCAGSYTEDDDEDTKGILIPQRNSKLEEKAVKDFPSSAPPAHEQN
jgi:hypothetical protein